MHRILRAIHEVQPLDHLYIRSTHSLGRSSAESHKVKLELVRHRGFDIARLKQKLKENGFHVAELTPTDSFAIRRGRTLFDLENAYRGSGQLFLTKRIGVNTPEQIAKLRRTSRSLFSRKR